MDVSYDRGFEAWGRSLEAIRRLATEPRVRRICEVGAGANPALGPGFAAEHGKEYLLLDRSAGELDKAPAGYSKRCADIASPGFRADGSYDLIFSRMLAEHVPDAPALHRNVFGALAPGGRALHFFPTLYAPPFLLNRLLPETYTGRLLDRIQPGRDAEGDHGKFRAHYAWCRGPMRRQARRYERLGYVVDEYVGFFGTPGYYVRVPLLRGADRFMTDVLLRRPIPWLTSYAYVVLRRP